LAFVFLAAIPGSSSATTLHHGLYQYDDETYVYRQPQITAGLRVSEFPGACSLKMSISAGCYGYMLIRDLNAAVIISNVLLHTLVRHFGFFSGEMMAFVAERGLSRRCLRFIPCGSIGGVDSERKTVLCGSSSCQPAGLRTLRFRRPCNRSLFVASNVLFALGLMAKPMLVTLPCVLLLLDYWPLRRFGSSLVRQ